MSGLLIGIVVVAAVSALGDAPVTRAGVADSLRAVPGLAVRGESPAVHREPSQRSAESGRL